MPVLSIYCVVARQWLKLHVPNFHTFETNSLLSRASTVQVANSQPFYIHVVFISMLPISDNSKGVVEEWWRGIVY